MNHEVHSTADVAEDVPGTRDGFARAGGARLVGERLIELILRVSAWASGAMIMLVLAFILWETIPSGEQPVIPAPMTANSEQESYGEDALGPGARSLAARSNAPHPERIAEPFSWNDLAGSVWDPLGDPPRYGLLALILGSVKVAGGAMVLAAPLGILAAIFTVIFAPRRVGNLIKPSIELLAGIPTVILGFLGLVLLAPLLQSIFGYPFRLNGLLAGIVVAIAVVPIVYTTAEDALWRVPLHLREGSLALGASRWQTTWHMLLPAAGPGILAGVMLGLGRAVGETMIVLMIAGNAPIFSLDPLAPARTMSATLATEMGTTLRGESHYHVLYALAMVLFLLTLVFNIAGSLALGWARDRRHQGGAP